MRELPTCLRFNLVIEVLLISRLRGHHPRQENPLRFNLVIEVLLISREGNPKRIVEDKLQFQSRNRGSFDFKFPSDFPNEYIHYVSIS